MTHQIDQRLLRHFLAAVEHRSITAASRALNISQPALTKSIRRLEADLGVALLDRHAGGVTPTRFGESLARRAKLVDLELQHAAAEIESMKGGGHATVTIGAGPVWTISYLPPVVARLAAERPDLKIAIVGGVLDTLVPGLLDGAFDLICAALDFPNHPEIQKEHLVNLDHAVFARAGHPLAQQNTRSRNVVGPEDLLAYPWVALMHDYGVVGRLNAYFAAGGLGPPHIAAETNTVEGAFAILRETDFLTSASAPLADHATALGLVALPLKGTFWHFPAGLAYRKSLALPHALSAVIAVVKDRMGGTAPPPDPGF